MSAGLVGVCLTVIGLFRVVVASQHVDSIADNLLVFDALFFLAACVLAYCALRTRTDARWRLERVADMLFLLGLATMVVVGGLIAYEVI